MSLGTIDSEVLIIPHTVLEQVSNGLFGDDEAIVVGRIDTQEIKHTRSRHWLVRSLSIRREMPIGKHEPPVSTFLVLVTGQVAGSRTAAELASKIAPEMNQRLIVVVLAQGNSPERWDSVILIQQQVRHLTEIRILESAMPVGTVDRRPQLPDAFLEQRDRLAGATSWECVQKIHETSIAVVGAGRNGSRIVQLLANLGFGRILVIDDDTIEASNLDAMDCVSRRDVGKPKALRVSRFAHRLRPEETVVSGITKSVTDEAAIAAIKRADMVVSAVDSDTPRLFLSLMAARYLKPHLDVACGVIRSESGEKRLAGDIRFLLPGDGCLHCAAGGLPNEQQARHELLAQTNAVLPVSESSWRSGDRLGSLATLNSITCGIGVQMLVDFLDHHDGFTGEQDGARGSELQNLDHSFWQRFEWIPGRGIEAESSRVGPADDCEVCSSFQ